MADIRFNISMAEVTAKISPASVRMLAEMSPIMRADLLKDVLHDATLAYEAAVNGLFPPKFRVREVE